MLSLLVTLLIGLLLLGLAWYLIGLIPLPPPLKTAATVVLVVIGVIFMIYILMGLVPMGGRWGLR